MSDAEGCWEAWFGGLADDLRRRVMPETPRALPIDTAQIREVDTSQIDTSTTAILPESLYYDEVPR